MPIEEEEEKEETEEEETEEEEAEAEERGCDGVDWISVARDRNRWQTVVSTVMNLRLLQNADNFFY